MKTKMKYSVILNILPDSDSPYAELFDYICYKVLSTKDNSKNLYHFWCSEIDDSHPYYLEILAHKPTSKLPTEPPLRLRIPHNNILLISAPPLEKKKIGFQNFSK